MTTFSNENDQFSIRIDDDDVFDIGPANSLPRPGPMAFFVVILAVIAGLGVALGFQTFAPDTSFIILGGTLMVAGLMGIMGLYRYQWFLLTVLAIRPALDDLIADAVSYTHLTLPTIYSV